MDGITLERRPSLSDDALNSLFQAAWDGRPTRRHQPILARSLTWIGAFEGDQLVGFVNLAWDGGAHTFLLDPTVHPRRQRQGIGRALVREAIAVATETAGVAWVHVDYEPHLTGFYETIGFTATAAGVYQLGSG